MKIVCIILSLCAYMATANAVAAPQTRYIVDQAKLPLRSGQGTKHKIIAMLPSGTPVTLLEQSPKGYSHIRTPKGKEGWILSRYLMKSPAARDQLAKAEKALNNLAALQHEKESLAKALAALQQKHTTLQQELDRIRNTAANAVKIADENRALQAKADAAQHAYETLQQETHDIRSGAQQRWFMLGGGAVLLGILLGLLLPRIKVRRKDRWGHY